jgi:hypothetical protein
MKEVRNQIKDLCNEELKFCNMVQNKVIMLFPYSKDKIVIYLEGITIEEQVEDFVSKVNQILDNMIDHLEDCKL